VHSFYVGQLRHRFRYYLVMKIVANGKSYSQCIGPCTRLFSAPIWPNCLPPCHRIHGNLCDQSGSCMFVLR